MRLSYSFSWRALTLSTERWRYHLPHVASIVVATLVVLNAWGAWWEWERMHRKAHRVARVKAAMHQRALTLKQWLRLPLDAQPYRRVRFHAAFSPNHAWVWSGQFYQGVRGVRLINLRPEWHKKPMAMDWGWYAQAVDKKAFRGEVMALAWPLPRENHLARWMRRKHPCSRTFVNFTQRSLACVTRQPVAPLYFKIVGPPGGEGMPVKWVPRVSPERHAGYAFEFAFFAFLGLWGYVRLARQPR